MIFLELSVILHALYANSYADSQNLLDETFKRIWSIFYTNLYIFALVVNTNEKTTAANVLMNIFFALKLFVVITLIFLIDYTYYFYY